MWIKIKQNFRYGIDKLKWFAALLSERLRIEISLFRIFGRIEKLERRQAEIMNSIGEYIYEIRLQPIIDVYNQKEVRDYIKEIEEIESEIEKIKGEAREISVVEE